MKRLLVSSLCFAFLAATARAAEPPSARTLARPTDASAPLRSGIDMSLIEPSVRPQDDLPGSSTGDGSPRPRFRPTNPPTARATRLRPDAGSAARHRREGEPREAPRGRRSSDRRSTRASWTRRGSRRLGLQAARSRDSRASMRMQDKQQIAALIAHLNAIGVDAPFGRRCTRTTRTPPSTSSISARVAWACPTATTT